MQEQSKVENSDLKLNESAKDSLKEIARWTYYLSIIGYIAIALLFSAGLYGLKISYSIRQMGSEMYRIGGNLGILMAFLKIVMALIYVYPVYYLNKFSLEMKEAINENDSAMLAISFEYLQKHYKYIGVMTLVISLIYFLLFIGNMFA